ncbi:hypothetical protein EB796_007231 [Bugula neritina]|uniref:Uncharacterized protein n=1 Tax=Bugula neritina TaxID=10212 RepID=A0A7J7K8C7_BUGNE|nr:hypothetical protein EB796_007231 [Bugula neritina]
MSANGANSPERNQAGQRPANREEGRRNDTQRNVNSVNLLARASEVAGEGLRIGAKQGQAINMERQGLDITGEVLRYEPGRGEVESFVTEAPEVAGEGLRNPRERPRYLVAGNPVRAGDVLPELAELADDLFVDLFDIEPIEAVSNDIRSSDFDGEKLTQLGREGAGISNAQEAGNGTPQEISMHQINLRALPLPLLRQPNNPNEEHPAERDFDERHRARRVPNRVVENGAQEHDNVVEWDFFQDTHDEQVTGQRHIAEINLTRTDHYGITQDNLAHRYLGQDRMERGFVPQRVENRSFASRELAYSSNEQRNGQEGVIPQSVDNCHRTPSSVAQPNLVRQILEQVQDERRAVSQRFTNERVSGGRQVQGDRIIPQRVENGYPAHHDNGQVQGEREIVPQRVENSYPAHSDNRQVIQGEGIVPQRVENCHRTPSSVAQPNLVRQFFSGCKIQDERRAVSQRFTNERVSGGRQVQGDRIIPQRVENGYPAHHDNGQVQGERIIPQRVENGYQAHHGNGQVIQSEREIIPQRVGDGYPAHHGNEQVQDEREIVPQRVENGYAAHSGDGQVQGEREIVPQRVENGYAAHSGDGQVQGEREIVPQRVENGYTAGNTRRCRNCRYLQQQHNELGAILQRALNDVYRIITACSHLDQQGEDSYNDCRTSGGIAQEDGAHRSNNNLAVGSIAQEDEAHRSNDHLAVSINAQEDEAHRSNDGLAANGIAQEDSL